MASDDVPTAEADPWTKPAFLRRVRIRGYKSIAACDVVLQPLTILVGRNAAGKSNFLNALAFVRDVVDAGASKAVKQHGGWSSVLCRTAGTSVIEIEVETDFICGLAHGTATSNLEGQRCFARYSLELALGHRSFPMIHREEVGFTDETGRAIPGFRLENALRPTAVPVLDWGPAAGQPAIDSLPSEAFGLRQPDSTFLAQIGRSPFVDLADNLRAMGFYNAQFDAIRALNKPLAGELLRRDGSNLATIVRGLEQFDPRSFARAQEYLRDVAAEVQHFDSILYGEYETVRFQLRSAGTAVPTEFDAASMSDGTLRALCNIMAAFQFVPPHGHPSVVGIEEPETALHPAALRALVDAMREATQHTQILLTTHSPDLLVDRYLDAAGVLVVHNRDGVTQIAPVDSASREIVQKELYTLADLQRMDHLQPDPADLARQAQSANGSAEK